MGMCQKIECLKKDKIVWIIYGLCGDRDKCEEYCCYNTKIEENKIDERESS